jgi:hypothetical protein
VSWVPKSIRGQEIKRDLKTGLFERRRIIHDGTDGADGTSWPSSSATATATSPSLGGIVSGIGYTSHNHSSSSSSSSTAYSKAKSSSNGKCYQNENDVDANENKNNDANVNGSMVGRLVEYEHLLEASEQERRELEAKILFLTTNTANQHATHQQGGQQLDDRGMKGIEHGVRTTKRVLYDSDMNGIVLGMKGIVGYVHSRSHSKAKNVQIGDQIVAINQHSILLFEEENDEEEEQEEEGTLFKEKCLYEYVPNNMFDNDPHLLTTFLYNERNSNQNGIIDITYRSIFALPSNSTTATSTVSKRKMMMVKDDVKRVDWIVVPHQSQLDLVPILTNNDLQSNDQSKERQSKDDDLSVYEMKAKIGHVLLRTMNMTVTEPMESNIQLESDGIVLYDTWKGADFGLGPKSVVTYRLLSYTLSTNTTNNNNKKKKKKKMKRSYSNKDNKSQGKLF